MDFEKFYKHLSENNITLCQTLIKDNKNLEPTDVDQSRILAEYFLKTQEFKKAYNILQKFKNDFNFKARFLSFVISCRLRDKHYTNKHFLDFEKREINENITKIYYNFSIMNQNLETFQKNYLLKIENINIKQIDAVLDFFITEREFYICCKILKNHKYLYSKFDFNLKIGKIYYFSRKYHLSNRRFIKTYYLNKKDPIALRFLISLYTLSGKNLILNYLCKKYIRLHGLHNDLGDALVHLTTIKNSNYIKLILELIRQNKLKKETNISDLYPLYTLARYLNSKKKFYLSSKMIFYSNNLRSKFENQRSNLLEVEKIFETFASNHNVSPDNLSLNDNKIPIFILGLPRSGTTLMEQILGQSAYVKTFGETLNLQDTLKYFFNYYSFEETKKKFDQMNAVSLKKIGGKFISKYGVAKTYSHFTEKNPYNYVYLNLIPKIFMKYKIIILQRSLIDVGFSIYMNYFSNPNDNYTFDQKRILTTLKIYLKILSQFKKNNKNFLEVNYHDLVTNLNDQFERIYDYCELNSALKKTNNNKKIFVDTASKFQVRKKIDSNFSNYSGYRKYFPNFFQELESLDKLN